MRILITTDLYLPAVNGVVTSVCNLARELTKLGHEVRIVTLSERKSSYGADNVYYIGAVGAGFIYPGARIRVTSTRGVVRELLDWKPDVVHSQCEFSTFLTAKKIARELNVPLIHSYHTIYEDYAHYFCPNKKLAKALVSRFSRWIANRSDAFVVPTEKVRSILEDYKISCPLYIIPSGIMLEAFCEPADPDRRREVRARYGVGEGDFLLIYVGRLGKEKNTEELIGFMSELPENVHFMIVGDGPYRSVLEAEAQKSDASDRVHFTGMVPPDEVAEYYKLGNVFVNASTSETQGLTYVEALACGLPMLCRYDVCLRGVIEDGKNGYFYENQEDFTAYVSKLLSSSGLCEQMSRAARESSETYSAEAFAKAAMSAYTDLRAG